MKMFKKEKRNYLKKKERKKKSKYMNLNLSLKIALLSGWDIESLVVNR